MNDDMGFDEKLKELCGALNDALSGMADKVNGALNSKGFQINARRVLAGRLREAAERPDLSWPVLCDVLCVSGRKEAVRALAAMVDPKYAPTEEERRILDAWPKYEDGGYVWFGSAVDTSVGCITAEAIEFEDGVAYVKDGPDGDWCTSVPTTRAMHRLVLDACGVPIRKGEVLRGVGRSQHLFQVLDPHHIDPEVGEAFSVRCYDRDEGEECHCRSELLTHDLPDSWEQLESDANKDVVDYWGCASRSCYACPAMIDGQTPNDRYGCRSCKIAEHLDIIRRAKALAGVEVEA